MGAWGYCPRPRTPQFFDVKNLRADKYFLYGNLIHFKTKSCVIRINGLTQQCDLRLGKY